jgi:ABC-type cobalt transport system substrate-binding protein
MRAELMAMASLVAFFGFMKTSTVPWEGSNGRALQVISDLTGNGYAPWIDTPWQPSLEQRFLIFGLCAIASGLMVYTMRFRKDTAMLNGNGRNAQENARKFRQR